MPEAENIQAGWCFWERRQGCSSSLHPPSLLLCLCPSSSSSSKVPIIQSSPLPRPGAVWLPAPGCRFCLCWCNDLSQPFQSDSLHTVLLWALCMAHICLEVALLCNAQTCPQRHKELTQCNFPNKTKGSASFFYKLWQALWHHVIFEEFYTLQENNNSLCLFKTVFYLPKAPICFVLIAV